MGQRDFNRDMGAYLRERTNERPGKSGSFIDKLKESFPKVTVIADDEPEQPVAEDVPQEYVQAVMRGESVPKPDPIEEAGEEIEEGIVRTVPFWRRWVNWLAGDSSDNDYSVSEDIDMSEIHTEPRPKKGAVDADVKEMLRICVHWVNMLPAEKIQDIKRSDDYQKFKDMLEQYGLLKK